MTDRLRLPGAAAAALGALALILAPPASSDTGGRGAAVAAPPAPSVAFGELYPAVEMAGVFADQKTFADAVPKAPPSQILAEYRREAARPGFDLKAFVARNFSEPLQKSVAYKARPDRPVTAYIRQMWSVLQRRPQDAEPYSSLLPLKRPYIVPGGRFSEIYYWDSYFSMLGLEQDGRHDLALGMLQNMASLINRYGHIPNGNRTYYLSRSQPPFFASMVDLIAARDGDSVYRAYLPELEAEYRYWMEGADALAPGGAHRHVVRLSNGAVLNRYWDDRDVPRDESYKQDVETAKGAGRPAAQVYRDLRAAAESGWDFSTRWLGDGAHLSTVRTTDILPVDLNCLLAHLEQVLAKAHRLNGDAAGAGRYEQRARARIAAIRAVMWDARAGLFADYLITEQRRSAAPTAATVYPLFFHIAEPAQARAVARRLRRDFLAPGGLRTTLVASGQQWDRPNGWAPLQYMAVAGLNAYGQGDLARDIAARWMREDVGAYEASGVLAEKYDVETAPGAGPAGGGGGEYALQLGFGWTNGVLARLMALYPKEAAAALRPPSPARP